jgi:5S rRNA maturation endonuclease (ribonuclease M5)
MSSIKVRGQTVEVDIRAELEQFNWVRPKWSADKLIAASPFRYDKTPSFFVNLVPHGDYPAGIWSDSGAYDAEWASGNFVKLMSFLRNETYEETEEYLLGEYGIPPDGTDSVKLKPINLRIQRNRQPLNADILAKYTEDYTYLKNRGISEDVQRQMGVLYNPQQKAAVIPWRLASGSLANVKYRKTFGKTFYYERGGWPIRELVYGIEKARPTTVICEAEIDALSWQTAGVASIAVGGASFNEWKRDLILRSPIETLVIATDNDKAGGKLRREIESMMRGHVRLRHAYVPEDVKDANEALVKYGADALRDAVEKSEGCRSLYVNIRRKDLV